MTGMKQISIKESLSYGWETFKKEPWKLIGAVTVAIVISSVSSSVLGDERYHSGLLLALFQLLNAVIQMFVSLGLVAFALKAHDDLSHIMLTDAWRPDRFWSYVAVSILTSIVSMIGFVLLVVPGIIAAMTLMFAPYIVVDQNLGPIDSMKKSYALAKGHWGKLFLLMLALIIINTVGALLLGVGLLVSVPISILTIVHVYRSLAAGDVANPDENV